MAVYLFDSFSGTGLIGSHTPEINFVDQYWVGGYGTPSLANGIVSNTNGMYGSLMTGFVFGEDSLIPAPVSIHAEVSFVMPAADPGGSGTGGALVVYVASTPIYARLYPTSVRLETNTGFTDYAATWSFPGNAVVAVEISGTTASLYVAGVLVGSRSYMPVNAARGFHSIRIDGGYLAWGSFAIADYVYIMDIGETIPVAAPGTTADLFAPIPQLLSNATGPVLDTGYWWATDVFGGDGLLDYRPFEANPVANAPRWIGNGLVTLNGALRPDVPFVSDTTNMQPPFRYATIGVNSLDSTLLADRYAVTNIFLKFKAYGSPGQFINSLFEVCMVDGGDNSATLGLHNDFGEIGLFVIDWDTYVSEMPSANLSDGFAHGLKLHFQAGYIEVSLVEWFFDDFGLFNYYNPTHVLGGVIPGFDPNLGFKWLELRFAGNVEITDFLTQAYAVEGLSTPKLVLYDPLQFSEYNIYNGTGASFDGRISPISTGAAWVNTVGTAAITGNDADANQAQNTSTVANAIGELVYGSPNADIGLPSEYHASLNTWLIGTFPAGGANYFTGVMFVAPELTVEVKLAATAYGTWAIHLITTPLTGTTDNPAPVVVSGAIEGSSNGSFEFRLTVSSGNIVLDYALYSDPDIVAVGALVSTTTYAANTPEAGVRTVALRLGPQVAAHSIAMDGVRAADTYDTYANLRTLASPMLFSTGLVFDAWARLEPPSPTQFSSGVVSCDAYANLRVPMQSLVGYSGATLAAECPMLELTASGTVPDHVVAELIAPSPMLELTASGRVLNHVVAALVAPSTTLFAFVPLGYSGVDASAPLQTLLAYFAGWGRLEPPTPRLVCGCTVTRMAAVDLVGPSPMLVSSGVVAHSGHANLRAPMPRLIGYSGAVCSVSIRGRAECVIRGTTGGIATLVAKCPLFELSASGTEQAHGGAELIAPSPELGRTLQAWLIAPRAQLTFIGTAVVEATYEAYAMNMLAPPQTNSVSEPRSPEVTRYTNFPFTHVVRYQNSYYGANATGLYLLEGTTDNGAAIPFQAKTCETDFGNSQLKTVESAYFSGRMSGAKTVTLYSREETEHATLFTTPRNTKPQNHRQVFPRGVKANYFAVGISGSEDFELDAIEMSVGSTKRRI